MNLQIKNKTAVISGADSGIGLETAKLLASEGVNIILTDITHKTLQKAAKELKTYTKKNNSVVAIPVDLTKRTEVDAFAKKVKKDFGGADILVNCAGIRGAAGDFLLLSDEDWHQTLDIDLMGAVRICRALLPQMMEKKWGRIVLIASENALQPYEEESPYNASKAGIINLGKCLSKAYSPKGVMINCVSPAYIKSPMTDAMMKDLAEQKNSSTE